MSRGFIKAAHLTKTADKTQIMSQSVDSLIQAEWIIPVEPANQVLKQHTVVVNGGRIVDLLPADEATHNYTTGNHLQLDGHVLIPGLVNAHTHAAMTLLRGLADDLPLMTWLNEHIWPAEGTWVGEEFVADGTRLAVAEMLLSGTTCFNDMYFFPDITGHVAAAAGIRTVLGLIVIDFPSAWASDGAAYIRKGLEVHDQFRTNPLIHSAFAPHAPYTVSEEWLQKIRVLADELDVPIHMHLHESHDEIVQSLQTHGVRPIERMQDIGLLSPALMAVHMTQLEDQEIIQFAESGSHVVHCPESNLKLASGICPVAKLLDGVVNLALGTDGAASNNNLDMFGEMRTAALLAKGHARDASAAPAHQMLEMATINGARALGLGDEIGSISPGKSADLVAVDLNQPATQPVYNPVSQLVYACHSDQVTQVWVAGKQLVRDRRLTTLDRHEVMHKAKQWRDRIHSA